jgi:hypothetical protein
MNSFTRYKSGEKCKIFSPLFFYCMHHDILLQHIRLYCFQLKSDQRFAKIFLVGQGESRLNFWRGQRRCPIRKRPQRIGWFLFESSINESIYTSPAKRLSHALSCSSGFERIPSFTASYNEQVTKLLR